MPAGDGAVPYWVIIACAIAIAFGTAAGGVRIISAVRWGVAGNIVVAWVLTLPAAAALAALAYAGFSLFG